jgi:hypothetical protein
MVKERQKWFRAQSGKYFHPDKFNRKVVNGAMRLENQYRFASLKMALDALVEWDEVAIDENKQEEARNSEEFDDKLVALMSWESELYVQSLNAHLDFLDYRQPKRQRTKKNSQ